MNSTWQALAREAGLAAEHLAIGVTALGKANYSQHAYYYQAFFALSIGIERAAKLALVVDHALENRGAFPSNRELRNYGHNLKELLERLDQIAERRGLSGSEDRLPRSAIHCGIIETLSDFANNITRYYNLDLVTGNQRVAQRADPIRTWFEKVTLPILNKHYKPHHKRRDEQKARLIDQLIGEHTLVLHHAETGNVLDSVYEASMQTAITEFAKPYARMYVMQIIRFVARLLCELGYVAHSQQLQDIPYLVEFFAIFNNSDKYFKNRKNWSIYRY
ncbi:hypothetical protein MTAT_18270 [Moorella thermoacetica]|uniref:Uncharacterized protein n=1 Tax=Neomoorella thermoacetica TaxID=1525 RepID=A0AAC9MU27_NEOTH|nr:hypothetical protein [Moorella thermoacetica]AOQ23295.1 hypothetical protein Maut_00835 [Moorella thermoacetica]TYL13001.1 hypothetical protein MTAT_18270 [Moorella thermoacetica]